MPTTKHPRDPLTEKQTATFAWAVGNECDTIGRLLTGIEDAGRAGREWKRLKQPPEKIRHEDLDEAIRDVLGRRLGCNDHMPIEEAGEAARNLMEVVRSKVERLGEFAGALYHELPYGSDDDDQDHDAAGTVAAAQRKIRSIRKELGSVKLGDTKGSSASDWDAVDEKLAQANDYLSGIEDVIADASA